MDKNKVLKYQIFSTIFVIILGTLLHFTFEWSGRNQLVAIFSSVNESTWEHLKLAFFPMFLSAIIGFFIFNKNKQFLCSKTIGIITAISFITIFFYTYTGILGKNLASLDISSFIFAIVLGEYISYRLIISNFKCTSISCIWVLFILLFCFILFTFSPPKIQLFKDPITGEYGISGEYGITN